MEFERSGSVRSRVLRLAEPLAAWRPAAVCSTKSSQCSLAIAILLLVAVSTSASIAQEKLTDNTFKKVDSPPKASLEDFAFLAGVWRGTGLGGEVEETWTEPLAGSIVGTFKLVRNGEPSFYELMVIAQRDETVDLRLKHFNADMTGWEEKDDYLTFSLVSVSENEANFGGLTYRLTEDDRLEVYLAMRSGGETQEVAFEFERQTPTLGTSEPSGHGAHGQHGRSQRDGHSMSHSTGHHRFADAEKWSRSFDDPARDAWQKPDEVVELMEIEPGMIVADVGAGTGYFMKHLAAAVGTSGRAVGLDIEPAMVEFMRKRIAEESWSNAEAREIEPDASDLEAGSLDRVLIVNTWHHIGAREDYSKTLRKALKPGGRVIIVDFTKETSHGPPPAHRLRADDVVAELEAGGLEAEIATESLPEQYVVVGRRAR